MSDQLLSIQKLLHTKDIQSYYWPMNAERKLAKLVIEIQTTDTESNHLEICEIPVPNSEVFLLQFFVQLPLIEPFGPDDALPEFLQGNLHMYIGALNQILPLTGFNCADGKICFRHIFSCELVTPEQLLYLIETIERLVQICQPSIQQVAIGIQDSKTAIRDINALFI